MLDYNGPTKISVGRIEVNSNILRCDIDHSPDLQPFFSGEPFYAEYNVDISNVPQCILAIPVLAHVCPVAWAQDATVEVQRVDTEFAKALQDVKRTLRQMYPKLMNGGHLTAVTEVSPEPISSENQSGLLFTGGVDSMSSYVRHRDENPALINISGWTVDSDDEETWEEIQSYLKSFGDEHGVDNYFIRSNMMTFLHHDILRAHAAPYVNSASGSWYTSIGHGVGLLGLCAPLAYATGLEDIYIAASHWDSIALRWGSSPKIDNKVRWAGTQCHHDGYHLTRQERLEVVADYIRSEGDTVQFQTCNSAIPQNCGDCEKCYRTSIGLLLAGLDPNDHGYTFDQTAFEEIQRNFEDRNWLLGPSEQTFWEDIQQHASPSTPCPYDGSTAFFQWLDEFDFTTAIADTKPSTTARLRNFVYRNTPYPVFNLLYGTQLYSYIRGEGNN